MFDRLNGIKKRYEEISERLADNAVIANQELFRELIKEHAALEDTVHKYGEYLKNEKELADAVSMAASEDEELALMAREELEALKENKEKLTDELKVLLLPKDPNDEKNVILEIRAGTGGEEAALFGMDLLRMYTRYAERSRYKMETLSSNYTELGGVKEIVLSISGKGAYSRLKYESGVHRVQRVPETESGGRIHTSAATVAVLPEAEDVDITINPNDLRVDVYRSGGHGGQSVNTTDSAVRITHLPTGLVVTCQDEKSQLKNKDKAMKVLKSRLYDMMKSEKEREYADTRKSQVGSGDRSERIRTYNFPQGRVTDHRIGLTLYKLELFLDGDMDEMIEALVNADKAQALQSAAQGVN
jgi:peptide chain release factor 1